jgi:hypothetical protein
MFAHVQTTLSSVRCGCVTLVAAKRA